jgi:GNAT superfamily N-acetyltransferase
MKIEKCNYGALTVNEIDRLYSLMIHAYAETENEVWGKNYKRLEFHEYEKILHEGDVYIAWMNDNIVGSISVYPVNKETFGFGLLNSDFDKHGKGIGGALVQVAEKHARSNGAKQLKLEILRPYPVNTCFKQWLAKWYEKLGYRFVKTIDFLDLEPHRQEKLERMITSSVFDVYVNDL